MVLEDIRAPEPKKNEILLNLHAAGVNFPDTLIIDGEYQFKPPFPFSPEGEASSVMETVGEKVNFQQLFASFGERKPEPIVSKVYPLERAGEAIDSLEKISRLVR